MNTSPPIFSPLSSVTLNGIVMTFPLFSVTSGTLIIGVTLVMLRVDMPATLELPLSNTAWMKYFPVSKVLAGIV